MCWIILCSNTAFLGGSCLSQALVKSLFALVLTWAPWWAGEAWGNKAAQADPWRGLAQAADVRCVAPPASSMPAVPAARVHVRMCVRLRVLLPHTSLAA